MADHDISDNTNGAGSETTAPFATLVAQYVKDISFENPNAPGILQMVGSGEKQDIAMDVNLNVRKQGEDTHEVELKMTATSKYQDKTVFVVEVAYAGLFQIRNANEQQLQGILLVHGPQLLFPFTRRIIADLTRDGGFRPLLLDPIDFAALYQQQAGHAQAETTSGTAPGGEMLN